MLVGLRELLDEVMAALVVDKAATVDQSVQTV
jgi:hypothetical protein